MRTQLLLLTIAAALAVPLTAGCHSGPKEFDSTITIGRLDVVHKDEQGNPISTDVEMLWNQCPGAQRQVMRSGKEFSACARKLKVGDTVPVKVLWEWDEHGHYDWHVIKMGDCDAPPVDDDDSSFDMIEECVPSIQHDAVVGFHCDRVPEGELLEKCPWFKRK